MLAFSADCDAALSGKSANESHALHAAHEPRRKGGGPSQPFLAEGNDSIVSPHPTRQRTRCPGAPRGLFNPKEKEEEEEEEEKEEEDQVSYVTGLISYSKRFSSLPPFTRREEKVVTDITSAMMPRPT